MLNGIGRKILDSLMPEGPIGVPKAGGFLDKLFDAMGDIHDAVLSFLEALADLRNPLKTTFLRELELDYGIIDTGTISEALRCQRLLAVKTEARCDGSAEYLEERLRASGFDVYVYANDPPVDPGPFLQVNRSTQFGNTESQFGNLSSQFGMSAGELVVNGLLDGSPLEDYSIPADPGYWPKIFFVGGEATRDPDGSLATVNYVNTPRERRNEIRSLIIKYKPMHAWCVLKAVYV